VNKHRHILLWVGALVITGVVVASPSLARHDDRPRISAADLRSFERYLDTHGDTAQELYRDPDLLNDRDYVREHQALRNWLEEHPEAAREIRANPQAVLWRERGRDADERYGASTRLSDRQRRSWDNFLADHRDIARDLSRNPDLLNDASYVRDHEALDDWLREHREAADIITANPRAYTARPSYSADSDADYGPPTASDLRSFEQYLNRNWEVADELYRNPDLVNDRRFVRTHPSLDDWLQAHPAAARAIRAQPQAYLWRQQTLGVDAFLRQLLTPR
jgi:hypothetical protein